MSDVFSAEDLKRYRLIQRRISILRELQDKFTADFEYRAGRQTRCARDAHERDRRVHDRVEKIREIQRILDDFIEENSRKTVSVLQFIEGLPDPASSVMYSRFILGLSWQAVSDKVHLSSDRCKHISADVIKQLSSK